MKLNKMNLIYKEIKISLLPILVEVHNFIFLIQYFLFLGCGKSVSIRVKDENLKCLDCGYRILFKMRLKKVMQFEAR